MANDLNLDEPQQRAALEPVDSAKESSSAPITTPAASNASDNTPSASDTADQPRARADDDKTEPLAIDDAQSPEANRAPALQTRFNQQAEAGKWSTAANDLKIEKDNETRIAKDNDISSIRNGAAGITGASQTKAGLATVNQGKAVAESPQAKQKQAEAARIAAWENTQISFGGITMTKAQALEAVQDINKNPDYWAKRAVERGDIKAGEEDKFKEKMKRLEELQKLEKEKAGKGESLSPSQTQEMSQIMKSPEVYNTVREHGEAQKRNVGYGATAENRSDNSSSYASKSQGEPQLIIIKDPATETLYSNAPGKSVDSSRRSVASIMDGETHSTMRTAFTVASDNSSGITAPTEKPMPTSQPAVSKSGGFDIG